MKKNELKSLLATTIKQGDTLTINFIPMFRQYTGDYLILETKKGKGKAGSQVCTVKNIKTQQVLSKFFVDGKEKMFGTPISEFILNVVHNGTTYGDKDEFTLPNAYPRDAQAASQISQLFDSIIGKHEGKKLEIDTFEPEFNGVWTFVSGRVVAGRHGQRILKLQKPDGTTKELWSYRHSGILKSVNLILDDDE